MEELLKFVELTQEFKAVRRKIVLAKEGREENDAEHSYQLALVAWYIISREKLNLDLSLCLKYALVHDLVEVYAGDAPSGVHKKYTKAREKKHEREAKAIQKLMFEFPEFEEMHDLIRGYELLEDEESKFISALDKVLPLMNIYLDKGHSWKLHGISLQDIVRAKTEKVSISPDAKKYFDLMIEKLESSQATLFPQDEAGAV